MTFYIVTNLVRERRQLNFLLNSLFLLATIVATAMVVQFVVGDSVHLFAGRVETLVTQGMIFDDITRIAPPGWSIVLVSFITLVCILVQEKFRLRSLVKFLLCGLFGVALLITFLRSYWAVLILVFIILAFLLREHDRHRLFRLGLVVVGSAAIMMLVLLISPDSRATRLAGAAVDRLNTLAKSETYQGGDGSLNWRMLENGYALSAIVSHPWIGMGMGFTYRPYDRRLDVFGDPYDFRRHIHNGHLWILLQSGLLGYLSFLCLSLAFLIRGFGNWRCIANVRMRGVVLGFTLVFLAVLIAAVVNSTYMQWGWTPVIGIIMGINEVILRIADHKVSEPVLSET